VITTPFPEPFIWWRCLPDLEHAAIDFTQTAFRVFDDYLLKAEFDAVWVFNGGTVDDERYTAFVDNYGLTLVEVEVGDDLVAAFSFNTLFYTFLTTELDTLPPPGEPPCYLSSHSV